MTASRSKTTADPLDETQLAAERELLTRSLERESKALREVRAALTRMGENNYGVCLNCEEEISVNRLNAVPWTRLCIACQEQEERLQGHDMSSPELPALAA